MSERLAIGIDLGGTQVRAALVRAGDVLVRVAQKTDVAGGPKGVLTQFRQMIAEVSGSAPSAALASVGVSAPGPLDTEAGTVLQIPTLPGWENFPLREVLAAELGVPVTVENDGIAAAYGEWNFGAGRGLRNLVFATVSTGIGGGVVIDGRLMHGRRGMAAHVGHFRLAQEGPRCACGAVACFEALAAGTALTLRAREAAAGNRGYLAKIAAGRAVEAQDVVAGARAGDEVCLGLMAQEAEYLGQGFTGLIHLFSPDKVVMGGGVSNAFDLLAGGIHAVIRRDAMIPFKTVAVVRAELGDNAGLVGAAALSLEQSRPSSGQ